MNKQMSFTSLEHAFRHELRDKLEKCEDTYDLELRFSRVVAEFMRQAMGGLVEVEDEDILLTHQEEPYFVLSPRLLGDPGFIDVNSSSDLSSILGRFAQKAHNDYLHMLKKDSGADQKIRNPQRG
ncbi:hypothetical protein [Fundidesulfovibrio agrisoli]|uniref:hypothetical protein n=1 Tax=Fundidesulfovibrio agrisoli TaxID=2922717 RepID=UPI001FAC199C|nr:hypothetical protein [Fundidesulfovibrio agrisoli]